MSGNENILSAGAIVVEPAARDVIVCQEQALISPALRGFGGPLVPLLNTQSQYVYIIVPYIDHNTIAIFICLNRFTAAASKRS